ncbi:MAG: hypothetical protein LKK00_00735 [Intestinimonas sp.]|jgi:hypothetical protein|nr:hypothetical protein [Intestinimonas sp.]
MKYYSFRDKIPLKFHLFLTMLLLPLNTAGSLYAAYCALQARAQLSFVQFFFAFFISVFSALLAVVAWNGLRLFRPIGFYGIFVLVWFNTLIQLTLMILIFLGITSGNAITSAERFGYWLLFSACVTFYYGKRKILFGFSVSDSPPAPAPKEDPPPLK